MKKLMWCLVLVIAVSAGSVFATEHYPNGVEGIKAGSVPPPGLYLRTYGYYYGSDDLQDADVGGAKINPDFDLTVFAIVPRLIWVSKYEVLGGNFFMDALIPFVSTDAKMTLDGKSLVDNSDFGVGDLCVEPIGIAWHGDKYDAAVGIAAFLPTGKFDKEQAMTSPGKDYLTWMFSAGGTVYFDEEKSVAASLLARYETHDKQDSEDITRGDDFHFEWGISKTIGPMTDIGIVGYSQWQVSDDKGADVFWDGTEMNEVHAIGAEYITAVSKPFAAMISARVIFEADVKDRTDGTVGVLTVTKAF